jgi:gamma-glutamyltranspeptidase/glutathione hydrolase
LLQFLAILDHTDIADRGPSDPQSWFAFAQASRLMYADRDRYVADPQFVPVPVERLLDPDYLADRARLIGDHLGPPPPPGQLAGVLRGVDATREAQGTSHLVVMDPAGNVVSMTTTVESVFGSGRTVGGSYSTTSLRISPSGPPMSMVPLRTQFRVESGRARPWRP